MAVQLPSPPLSPGSDPGLDLDPDPVAHDPRGQGLAVLWECDRPEVDICFVHGLAGTREGTWRAKGREKPWPQEFLPPAIPTARIMTFGYDAQIFVKDPGAGSRSRSGRSSGSSVSKWRTVLKSSGGGSTNRLRDHATNLLSDLYIKRSRGRGRPIIFVAHSLGGLLCKEALLMAEKEQPGSPNGDIFSSTWGIAFLGTPHRGSTAAREMRYLAAALERYTSASLLDNIDILAPDSQYLDSMRRDFADLLGRRASKTPINIVCFYEELKTETHLLSSNAQHIVPKASATLDGFRSGSICANHMNMAKFASPTDPGFERLVFGYLKYWVECLPAAVDLPPSSTVPPEALGAAPINLISNEEFNPQNTTPQNDTGQVIPPINASPHERCLESLQFPEMNLRYETVPIAYLGTCEWLSKHETYTTWVESNRGLLWIKGGAGTGKSTLLKHAIETYQPHQEGLIFSFFFHNRGSELQKTPLGLFRALLHQVMSKIPAALPEFVDLFQEKSKGPDGGWEWDLEEIKPFFARALIRVLKSRPVWLFIDALDECSNNGAPALVAYIKSLYNNLPPADGNMYPFHICYSCRPYPGLDRGGFEICPERENRQDIASFVQDLLFSYCVKSSNELLNLMSRRALGNFMWARLVADQVVEFSRSSQHQGDMELQIESIPVNLDSLYTDMLEGLGPASLRLFQWLCFSLYSMALDEWRWAIVLDPLGPHQSLAEYKSAEDYFEDDEDLERHLEALGGGFVEIVDAVRDPRGFRYLSNRPRIVQFVHQSVKDFFLTRGLAILEASLAAPGGRKFCGGGAEGAVEKTSSSASPERSASDISRFDDEVEDSGHAAEALVDENSSAKPFEDGSISKDDDSASAAENPVEETIGLGSVFTTSAYQRWAFLQTSTSKAFL
ncbi:Ankyrin Repeat [Geosmithia morbida]|uniref:Ankyrin Repeat n=1 Tax=Geosmithia morbida TaxID=1094350 RepID=A0A9P4Z2S2_9HYPO|nr:Ankyrin Repeat [Geosmithia morbida]KAF4126369.1 Ankyrin Repeat [Geosmithia morbida]